jgi:hypothetical protein
MVWNWGDGGMGKGGWTERGSWIKESMMIGGSAMEVVGEETNRIDVTRATADRGFGEWS